MARQIAARSPVSPRHSTVGRSVARSQGLATVLAIAAISACSPGLDDDSVGWTLAVPSGTPVRRFDRLATAARSETLSLKRDLVLEGAFDADFHLVAGVGVDDDGAIYVLDQGNQRVVRFDADGRAQGLIGRPGHGPGEFQWPQMVSVTGGRIYLYSPRLARVSVFDLEGTHIADHAVAGSSWPTQVVDFNGRLFVVDGEEPTGMPRPGSWSVGEYSEDWRRTATIMEREIRPKAYWSTARGSGMTPVREAYPRAAFSGDTVYVADGLDYQVLALRLPADVVWALRTDYTPPSPSEEFKRALMGHSMPDSPDWRLPSDPNVYSWPDRFAAIENLEVDGHGNLYVFSHADRSPAEWREVHRPVPVDVYTAEGELIFSGLSPIDGWEAALHDHVYRVERDPETGEYLVVRYQVPELGGA